MKIIIISDDAWFLSGLSEGMKICGKETECLFVKNSEEWHHIVRIHNTRLPEDTLVFICVSDVTLLKELIHFFFNTVQLCIAPPGLNSSRPFFYQNGIYYFNKRKTLAELNDIFMHVSVTKPTTRNTITEREFYILNVLIRTGSVKGVYDAVKIPDKVVSYYKRSALKKMGLLSYQNYQMIHPAIEAGKAATRRVFYKPAEIASARPDEEVKNIALPIQLFS
ncbi:TPA: hypothetical protein ACXIMN_004649 [Escherichia coli]